MKKRTVLSFILVIFVAVLVVLGYVTFHRSSNASKDPLTTLAVVDLKNFTTDKFYLSTYASISLLDQTKDGFLLKVFKKDHSSDVLQFNLSEKKILPQEIKAPKSPMLVDTTKGYFFYCTEINVGGSSTYHLFDLQRQQDTVLGGDASPICGVGNFYSQKNEKLFLSYCGGGRGGYTCDYGVVDITTKQFNRAIVPEKPSAPSEVVAPSSAVAYVKSKNLYIDGGNIYKLLEDGTPYQVGRMYTSPELNGAVVDITGGAAADFKGKGETVFISPDGRIRNIAESSLPLTLSGELFGNYFVYTFN